MITCWDSNTSTDIGGNGDNITQCSKTSAASTASSGRQQSIVWVCGVTVDVIVCLRHHHSHRNICFHVENSTQFSEHSHKYSVLVKLLRIEAKVHHANSSSLTLDVEIVFHGNGQSMERTLDVIVFSLVLV